MASSASPQTLAPGSDDGSVYYYAIRRCQDGGGEDMRSCIFLRWTDCRRYLVRGGASETPLSEDKDKGGAEPDAEYGRFTDIEDALRYLRAASDAEAREVIQYVVSAAVVAAAAAAAMDTTNDDQWVPRVAVPTKRKSHSEVAKAGKSKRGKISAPPPETGEGERAPSQTRRIRRVEIEDDAPVHIRITEIQRAQHNYNVAFDRRLQALENVTRLALRPVLLGERHVGGAAEGTAEAVAEEVIVKKGNDEAVAEEAAEESVTEEGVEESIAETIPFSATLSPRPQDLHTLWREWEFGIDGRKAAKLFTLKERGAVKYHYHRRKFMWEAIERLVRLGFTPEAAISKIRAVYHSPKRPLSITNLIKAMKSDKKRGGHPGLKIENLDVPPQSDNEGHDNSDEKQPFVTLLKNPRDLQTLWQEYEFGVEGRKPARLFTSQERGTVKFSYSRRSIVWGAIQRLMQQGHSSEVAIHKIEAVYGKQAITNLIKNMRHDERNGGHPHLR